MIAAPWLFSFVFGESWHDSGIYASLLSPLILSRFIATPIMYCLNVMERQLFQLCFNIVRLISVIVIFKACSSASLSPKTTILMYSIFFSLYYLFVIFIVFILLKKVRNNFETN
jgi:O-antigen/teichoic acid export membrane protein